MNNALTFCQMPLDRASTLRKDPIWLQAQLSSNKSQFYFFWRGKYLYLEQEICVFTKEIDDRLKRNFTDVEVFADAIYASSPTFLGTNADVAHFVCDLSQIGEDELGYWLTKLAIDKIKFIDFRRSLSLLRPQQSAILSYGKALIHWQQSALYCGCCGAKTKQLDGGHRRLCLNNSCQKEHFPRTDPAVIMLVEYQPKSGPAVCLLAEHHRTPEQVYSTLAGFVDPGESLEEAVTREVFEEAGVVVTNVRYVDSQPWPFPNSIMLGFIAQAQSMELCLEEAELRSASWFTAEQLADFNDWGDDVEGPKLPRKESIARLLIDSWCKSQLADASIAG
jgi:NAD+ diphosphatase